MLTEKPSSHQIPNCPERVCLRPIAVSEPVVMPDSIKGYFNQRITADFPKLLQCCLVKERTIRVQILKVHSVC